MILLLHFALIDGQIFFNSSVKIAEPDQKKLQKRYLISDQKCFFPLSIKRSGSILSCTFKIKKEEEEKEEEKWT